MRWPSSAGVIAVISWLAENVAVTASSSISRARPGASARQDRAASSRRAGASATPRPVARRAWTRRCSARARSSGDASGGIWLVRDSARNGAPPNNAASAARRRRRVSCGSRGLSSAALARKADSFSGEPRSCADRAAASSSAATISSGASVAAARCQAAACRSSRARAAAARTLWAWRRVLFRGDVVGRRPDQGVAEPQLRLQRDEAGLLGRGRGAFLDPGQFGCPPQGAGRRAHVGGRQEQELARVLRDVADAGLVVPAEPGADRERLVEQHLRRSAAGRQLAADLDDRERIALRPGRDLAGDPAIQRDVADGGQQQLYRVIQVQGRHGQVRDAGEDDFRLARSRGRRTA